MADTPPVLPSVDSYVTLLCRVVRVNPEAGLFLLDTNSEGPWYRPDHPAIVSIERPATPLRWGEMVHDPDGGITGIYVGLDPDGTGIVVAGCTCLGCGDFDGWMFSAVSRPDGSPIDWDATRARAKVEAP